MTINGEIGDQILAEFEAAIQPACMSTSCWPRSATRCCAATARSCSPA